MTTEARPRAGWLAIPGLQEGQRTLEQQALALRPAIRRARGKTVLDLGCAEGLIGREFARAGAERVIAIDEAERYLDVAREQCAGLPMEFMRIDLNVRAAELAFDVDIVLCLGIVHKMHEPAACLALAARSARRLVLIRSGARARDGIIESKHTAARVDAHGLMREAGFDLERVVDGPAEFREPVEYWRRRHHRTRRKTWATATS